MIKAELPVLDYREYQKPLIRYMRSGGKRGVWVAHRRSGKDVTCWQYTVEEAIQDVGTYYYCLPEFSHARRVIWDGMLNDGQRFINLIPSELIEKDNGQQMAIHLVNGSIIQLVGSDQYDRLVGTNPKGIVFSEYSITHPMAWQIMRPILAANNGWAIFNGTPRGKNHFHDMLQYAKGDDSWFWSVDTVETTGVLTKEVLDKEKAEMDPDVFLQEYYCSFDAALKGAYYSEQLAAMRDQNRICKVPHEVALPVYTVSDPGDVTYSIVYFQVHGKEVRIIDADEFYSPSPETIVTAITSKPYKYGKHFQPSDATVKKMAANQKSHVQQLQEAGLTDIQPLEPRKSVMEGIKQVQSNFASFWIHESLEKKVVEPLGNYAPIYNEKKRNYSDQPDHNWASHMSDAVCYMVMALPLVSSAMKPKKEYKPPTLPRYLTGIR